MIMINNLPNKDPGPATCKSLLCHRQTDTDTYKKDKRRATSPDILKVGEKLVAY